MDRETGGKGVITVFLSLLLPVFLAVIATCLESARYEGLRMRAALTADAAVQSVFAGYDRPLFERYGLLFVLCPGDPSQQAAKIAESYAIRNTQTQGRGETLLGITPVRAEAYGLRTAADGGGSVLLQEIRDLMQDAGWMEQARALAEEAGISGSESGKIPLVEYLMRTFRSLSDEAQTDCQLEYCLTGRLMVSPARAEMERRLTELRYPLYLACFEQEESEHEPGDASSGEAEGASAQQGPSAAEKALEAAERDARELLSGGAVKEHADGTGQTLTYLQFVRRLLYREDPHQLLQRAMEAMETDLRQTEPAFSFSRCVGGASFSITFRSGPLLPFSLFFGNYEFVCRADFAYHGQGGCGSLFGERRSQICLNKKSNDISPENPRMQKQNNEEQAQKACEPSTRRDVRNHPGQSDSRGCARPAPLPDILRYAAVCLPVDPGTGDGHIFGRPGSAGPCGIRADRRGDRRPPDCLRRAVPGSGHIGGAKGVDRTVSDGRRGAAALRDRDGSRQCLSSDGSLYPPVPYGA